MIKAFQDVISEYNIIDPERFHSAVEKQAKS